MGKLKVRDLMTTNAVTFRPDDTVKRATIKCAVDNVSGAPVVDNKNHLLGYVSIIDILELVMKYQKSLDKVDSEASFLERSMDSEDEKLQEMAAEISNLELSTIMTRTLITTSPDASVMEVLRSMLDMNITCLPVLEKGVLVGTISTSDIIFALYKKKA